MCVCFLRTDWLISRKHCKKDWLQSLNAIRDDIRKALMDMPEHEAIANILSGRQLTFTTCKQIVEILKETEADSKNIFGYYSSQRMKDWQDIISKYEKDSIFLGEAAQIISRDVNYEVPAIRKQILKLESTAEEMRKKQSDAIKHSNQFKMEYEKAARDFGILGLNVRKELTERLQDFPIIISDIHSKLSSNLHAPREFYLKFIQVVSGSNGDQQTECLPTVDYILRKGNTTYYEYLRGEKPEVIEEFKVDLSISSDDNDNPGGNPADIDFGDDDANGDGGIDFGIVTEDNNGNTGTPSSGSGSNGFYHVDKSDIDFSRRESNDDVIWDDQNTLVKPDAESRVAKGVEALSLLDLTQTRNQIINELSEVESFLEQRLLEMKTDDQNSMISILMSESLSQLNVDQASIEKMLSDVKEVLELMTCDKFKVLSMIRDNPKYIENAVERLKQKTDLSEKSLLKSKVFIEKEVEAIKEMRILSAQIPNLIHETRELQVMMQNEISKRYKNRPVNIMSGAQIL